MSEMRDGPCYYCGKPTARSCGNPSLWPIGLCHDDEPGKVKVHHIGCVSERLRRIAALEADLAQARKDESKVSGLLFDEIAHREKVEKERDEAKALYAAALETHKELRAGQDVELDKAHACLREVRGLLTEPWLSLDVNCKHAVQLIDKALGETR